MSTQKTAPSIWPKTINPKIIEHMGKSPVNVVMLGGFRSNKTYTKVFRLWVEYYYLTESFDRGLPGCQFHGDWVPFDKKASNDNARALKEKIKSLTRGVDSDTVSASQREARDIPFPKLEEIYDRLGTYYLSTPG